MEQRRCGGEIVPESGDERRGSSVSVQRMLVRFSHGGAVCHDRSSTNMAAVSTLQGELSKRFEVQHQSSHSGASPQGIQKQSQSETLHHGPLALVDPLATRHGLCSSSLSSLQRIQVKVTERSQLTLRGRWRKRQTD